jgi:phage tail sheath protein FI
MSELTFKSAGVSVREIDLSSPTPVGPVGVPAGVIGTSNEGPAYVPLTFATYGQYKLTYGASDGTKFGPIAASEWLKNAQALTYIRVLGVGDGKKRNASTGNVNRAGFVVGEQQVQSNGIKGNNTYANTGGAGEGRTYFLGCFMSESAGSTIFSDAGIQNSFRASSILRGVILAPSGVVLSLSGAKGVTNTAPAASSNSSTVRGFMTGSVVTSTGGSEFVLFMNGYKANSSSPSAVTASFDMYSPNYFANVLNTDPLKIEEKGHLLYGYYDIHPALAVVTGSGVITSGAYPSGEPVAFIMTSSNARNTALGNIPVYESFQDRFSNASSPFVISQKFGAAPYDLFKIETLSDGSGVTEKFKFSIENIVKSTSATDKYGTFDLILRDYYDSDDEKKVLESFRGLSLDPTSARYIGRVIGDKKIFFNFDSDQESQKIVVEGSHDVRSRYIRVVLSDALKNKEVPPESLPVGFRGPNHLLTSGSLLASYAEGSDVAISNPHKRIIEPPIPYRQTIAQGEGSSKREDTNLYWGIQTNIKTSITKPNLSSPFDNSFKSFVKYFPTHRKDAFNFSEGNNAGTADALGTIRDSDRFNYNKFTLENIQVRTGSSGLADSDQWISASYVRNGVISPNSSNKTRGFSINDFDVVSNRKFLKFTIPLQGGFDGVNIFNKDQRDLTNNSAKREIDDETNQGGTSGPTISAFRKALDIMGSNSDVDIQLLTIPGMRHESISDYAITVVENRFDAMLITDIEERDQFNTVITSSAQSPHVNNTVVAFKNRVLDSSFAAAYFPDVTMQDPDTGGLVTVPPSVVTLGAYSLNDRVGHPWYAPAGFTRGVLNSVETPSVLLNRTNLDDLYDADINPLAQYPGKPLSIWGQKTLMANSSALDRVNVRRLLIDVRRKVRNIANTLLFEPNRSETLDRFSRLVNPILQSIQDSQGVDRFKVIIDSSTTTQADIENNTIRGKIYLQPTRSVEFVALDFVVTNAGTTI